ncbi:MAG: flippase-like domain-containing protein [Acidobacteriota bacterium]|nr:flippase-like domain-containing protein [Acidobacteriota bacterium]
MKRILRNLVLLAVAIIVLGALLYHSRGAFAKEGFNWAALERSLQQTRLSLVLLAALAIYVCYAIRARRWVAFSRYLGRARFWNVYESTLMGFASVFLLGRAGEPVRPLLIARKDRLSISGTFGIYVLERLFDVAATLCLFGLGLLLATSRMEVGADDSTLIAARSVGLAMLGVLVLMIAFLVYFRLHGAGLLERRLGAWRSARGWRHKAAQMFAGFSDGLQAIRTWGDLGEAVAYSIAHWALVALAFLWVCHGFGGELRHLGYADQMLLLGVTMLGAMVQLPAVGGGAQAASFFALTAFFGVQQEPAAAAAIILWLVTFAAVLVVGVPLFIRQGLSMHELWQLASESKREEQLAGEMELKEHAERARR